MSFALLEKPVGTIDLMLYLYRHGKTSVNVALSDTGMSRDTFYGAIGRLISLGFAYRDEQTGFPTYVYIGLTKAGEEIASTLVNSETLLSSTARSLEAELARLDHDGDEHTVPRRLEILEILVDRDFSAGRWSLTEEKVVRLTDLAREAGDKRREAKGRLAIGRILQKQDMHKVAVDILTEAVQLAEAGGMDDLAAEAKYLIGSDIERQGRWTEAKERFDSAIESAAKADAPLIAARARQAKARILARQGNREESIVLMKQVAGEFERLGAEEELPRVYIGLGSATYQLGRPEYVDWYQKGLDSAHRTGDVRMEAYGLAHLAIHWIETEQYNRAEVDLKKARTIFEDFGEKTGLGTAELNLANLYSARGRWSDSEMQFDLALKIARETKNRFQEAYVFFNRAMMFGRRGLVEDAERSYGEAKRIFSELGNQAMVARCDRELAELRQP